jgi:hypothetical protein
LSTTHTSSLPVSLRCVLMLSFNLHVGGFFPSDSPNQPSLLRKQAIRKIYVIFEVHTSFGSVLVLEARDSHFASESRSVLSLHYLCGCCAEHSPEISCGCTNKPCWCRSVSAVRLPAH